MKNGKGVMKYANGDTFDGHFKDDKMEGTGKLVTHDGNEYSGEFQVTLCVLCLFVGA